MLAVVAFVSVVGSFGFPAPAKATIPVVITANPIENAFKIKDEILEGLKVAVQAAASTVVSYVLRKVAYDSAVWLASGGKGQSAFAQTKSFGDYLKNVGNDALGHGIEELSKGAGFNLCSIPDPKLDLAMKVGLRVNLGGGTSDPTSKPACTFTDFQKNWSADAWRSKFTAAAGSIEQQFNTAFQVDQTGLGIQLAATAKLNERTANAVNAANSERIANQGFIDKKTTISGDIQTPAAVLGEEFKATGNSKQIDKSGDQITAAINSGNYKNLPGALANFFLTTLSGTVLKNFQQKGILPFGLCIGGAGGDACNQLSNAVGNYADSGTSGGRRQAEQLFNGFLTVNTSAVDQYNILSQLNNCPTAPGLYNCRADSGLVQAAQEVGNGNPTTIQDALDKGWLHADYRLIPPSRQADNADINCYNKAYCYSNIKVLRQARILPLGFELAASQSDPDNPWTLGTVVKGFNDCNYITDASGAIVGVNYDPISKPFCHLIDPNWVIKAPAARCSALGYGANLLSSDAPDRLEDCVDLTSCVAYNKDGSCSNYGYCTREKNSWNFAADSCDAQFRTCQSYTDTAGAQRAYVARSLDTNSCTKDTVGCTAYSLSQDAQGNWQDVTGPDAGAGYVNNGVYFNNQVSTSCSANSAGCSAFQLASNSSSNLYLKKAPDYLGCYDSDPATKKVDYPETTADLARLAPRAECSKYAGACIPDEVSCNWYAPANGGTRIPGRFKAAEVIDNQIVWNDQCDAKCVGYAGYREMPSNYSTGQDVAYIIPASGSTCTAQEEGCSSFTNLSTALGQVENVEYYSYLRPCATPDVNVQKNFITYEGSTVGGYQLKVYTLAKDETGGPKYFYRTQSDAAAYDKICNETAYKAGQADADCRQFNDDAGAVYYRLLSKTIPVTNACTPYRLNNSELVPTTYDQTTCDAKKGFWNNNQCQVCLQGGEYKNGSCFYYGLPNGVDNTAGTSKSCQARANTCRAYKGNAGNNVREVVNDRFENGVAALAAWKPSSVQISNESTHAGEHSLGFSGSNTLIRSVGLTTNKSYDLTFWAKGDSQSLTVSLASADGTNSKDLGTVGIGDTWNQYHVGPIEYAGADPSGALVFKNDGASKVYLDNIRLVEVTGYVYLVKNTLKVDAVCDSNVNDNLPGEALGCMQYKDPSNKVFNLTGFNYLCREGAIGCTALFDTKNTPTDPGPKAYNIWLSGTGGTKVQVTIGSDTVSCQIPVGQQGCYVNAVGHTAAEIIQAAGAGSFVNSTVYIPSDTPTTTPVYLVANQAASCNVADLGCTFAGVQKATPGGMQYTTTLVKNDPAAYTNTLCQKESVGCSAFTSSAGSSYFKDPLITGQKICTYQTGVTVNGNKSNGWFWKNTGVCSNNAGKFCTANADCGGTATCQNIGSQPCYPNYIQEGSSYGLWSAGDGSRYQNFVGECPAAQNQCTEFVDPNDNNHPYYYLKNQKISSDDCDGLVDQKKGCVLFNETSNPTKFWSSEATYAAGNKLENINGVQPIAATGANQNDANILIKVARDRSCGEWLQCRSSHRVWDIKTNKWKNICDDIGRCNATPDNPSQGDLTNCANWVDTDYEYSNQVLDSELYTKRDISWKGMDFSGYSIAGIFPPEELSQVNVSTKNSSPDWRLVKTVPCGNVNCADGKTKDDVACKIVDANNPVCGNGNSGTCLNGICMKNITGKASDLNTNSIRQSCRAYPEKDSPFPYTTLTNKNSFFASANFCQETKNPSSDGTQGYLCECDYTKVNFADTLTRYWNYSNPNGSVNAADRVGDTNQGVVPGGICQGGGRDGYKCDVDDDCYKTKVANGAMTAVVDAMGNKITDGVCLKQKRSYNLLGWKGFCLEQDLSRIVNGDPTKHPCLSWLPVDSLVGSVDVNNLYPEAGYNPPANSGRYFCTQASVAGGAPLVDGKPTVVVNSNLRFGTDYTYMSPGNGNFNYDNASTGGYFVRDFIAATDQERKFTKEDIERIDFRVISGDNEDPAPDSWFSIWPNDPTPNGADPDGVQAKYKLNRLKNPNNGVTSGYVVTGKYLHSSNDFLLLYGSDNGNNGGAANNGRYVDENGNICESKNGGCDVLRGNPFKESGFESLAIGGGQMWGAHTSGKVSERNGVVYGICNGRNDASGSGNWHAVNLKFNSGPQGTLIGYDVAYCDNSGGGGNIWYEVSFKLKQLCTYVEDATLHYAQTPARGDTAPWTDRLWKSSTRPNYTVSTLGYTYDTLTAPFGSLEMGLFSPPAANSPIFMSPFQTQKVCTDMNKTVCATFFADTITKNNPAINGFTVGSPYSCPRTASNPNGLCYQTTPMGDGYTMANSVASGREISDGETSLSGLFARVYGLNYFNYTATGADRIWRTTDYPTYDITETAENPVKPPVVFPLGPCNSLEQCIEDSTEPGVTVNDRSDRDVKITSKTGHVFLKFYAFADANHMPLRKISVDWGDRPAPADYSGLYRNHRGFAPAACVQVAAGKPKQCQVSELQDKSCTSDADCGAGNTCDRDAGVNRCIVKRTTEATCSTDDDCSVAPICLASNVAPSFGRILDQTCDSSYFQFDHVYQCDARTAKVYPANECGSNPELYPNGCCKFKPAVRVEDNWGWCTGTCRAGGGCYNKPAGLNECNSDKAWIKFSRDVILPVTK